MSRRHRARIRRRLRILLLTSLITFLIAEVVWLEFAGRTPRPSGITAAIALPPIATPDPPTRYAAIVTGDLFSEARQPSERVLARVAVRGPAEAGALRILAIVVTDTDRVALVETAGSAEPLRLRLGDRAGPYRVLAISPDAITVENNGLTEVFAVPSQEAMNGESAPARGPAANPGNEVEASRAPNPQGLPSAAEGQEINRRFLEMRAMDKPDPTLAPTSPQSPVRPKS
ncbi:MAG: hypothetical protein U1E87_09780 [Alphaproteobacteria bacterium]